MCFDVILLFSMVHVIPFTTKELISEENMHACVLMHPVSGYKII